MRWHTLGVSLRCHGGQGMTGGKPTGNGISLSSSLQTIDLGHDWLEEACEKTAGNGVTASWVFQKLFDMLVGLDLHFFRKMLGWLSFEIVW